MSELELKQLIRKRGTFKSQISYFKKFVEGLIEVDENKILELELRLNKLETLFEECQSIQTQIEEICENYDEELAQRELVENSFYSIFGVAKQTVLKYKKCHSRESSLHEQQSVATDRDLASSGGSRNDLSGTVKLPQIVLKKFNGDYDSWLEFKHTYESLIHCNNTISSVQKFHYLNASLEGAAAQVIHSLEFTDNNYECAWKLLCERFDNKALLVNNHLKTLFNLPALVKESSTDLRKLIDSFVKHIRALESLGQPTETWDTLLIFILVGKLDKASVRKWEEIKGQNEYPKLSELITFLKSKADLLETLENNKSEVKVEVKVKPSSSKFKSYFSSDMKKCVFCQDTHTLNNCSEFLKLNPVTRLDKVKRFRLCINCLKSGHIAKNCHSGKCRKCNAQHNTLLHFESESPVEVQNANQSPSDSQHVALTSRVNSHQGQVFLSTAVVQIMDRHGYPHTFRAVLDCGSQSNFISTEACSRLGVQTTPINSSVVGISQTSFPIRARCEVSMESLHNAFRAQISCLVITNIGEPLPSYPCNRSSLNIPPHLRLADPGFDSPGKIDLLLGASIFWQLLCIGQHSLGRNRPMLQKTRLGWVVAGELASGPSNSVTHCNFIGTLEVQQQLERFLNIEEIHCRQHFTKDELDCEEMFNSSVERNSQGRFIVKIPLKDCPDKLGNSQDMALHRFRNLERRLRANPALHLEYSKFLTNYESLGHMSKVSCGDVRQPTYFMPHHGVINDSSSTTKLRVVFDASAPSDNGFSLNAIQYVGPPLQTELLSLLIRFRQHRFVVCADIEKMYRQILVSPEQRPLQQIVWRSDPSDPIETYQLNTVTYGTTSAPYLAIRCLHELSKISEVQFPRASHVLLHDFYVDDMITGEDDLEEVIEIAKEIRQVLSTACFSLHKWASNELSITESVDVKSQLTSSLNFDDEHTKTLGLYWICSSDKFSFKIKPPEISQSVTKRQILSCIAQVFDPLGILSPCIVVAKLILQRLWMYKLSWDESIPADLFASWEKFRSQLHLLSSLEIPRHILCKNPIRIELIGFSDASEHAYGACVYARTIDSDGNISVKVVASKTKVAPLKTLTIPRLELCAALILAQLIDKIKLSLTLPIDEFVYFSDSTVVLHWINTNPKFLQIFVANRVAQIQTLTNESNWFHVQSEHNPADLCSRGVLPSELIHQTLWWQGPTWLLNAQSDWLVSSPNFSQPVPEAKNTSIHVFTSTVLDRIPYDRCSSFNRLRRIIAYCLRFIKNSKPKKERTIGPLTVAEIQAASMVLIRDVQMDIFSIEIKELSRTHQIKGPLQKLSPFLDAAGILRVGGRLQKSSYEFDKKHPILLSTKHRLTLLLFQHEHCRLGHAAPQLLLASIREKYWVVGGRSLARRVTHNCVICFKSKPVIKEPVMGALPTNRFDTKFPFCVTGVDHAGPLLMKNKAGRGSKKIKVYICLFVCFWSKAIHIELVTDLTKEAFLLSLRRFVSRRGKPEIIYSDNAKNFVSASRELKELSIFLSDNQSSISESLANEQIKWHFIPPQAPHFGGLWEAGVKSTKFHLKRILGNVTPYEHLYTVLVQIEAILNSRPLCPLSSDPNDLESLTPSHFLLGRRLTSTPDADVTHLPENRTSVYQHLQQLRQHFWKRWHREYVTELQVRNKWKGQVNHLKIGALVLVKDDNLPPLRWQLGRILEVFPGADGMVRVANIRTHSGVLKRAWSKLCPLPVSDM